MAPSPGSLAKPVHRLLPPLPRCLGAECGCQRVSLPSPPQEKAAKSQGHASPPASPLPRVLGACKPTAFYGEPGGGGNEREGSRLGDLDASSLSYSEDLFSSRAYPWSKFMGEAAEVAGKGLRRIKIALASAWKPKPCHGSFQTLSFGGSQQGAFTSGWIPKEQCDPDKSRPQSPPRGLGAGAGMVLGLPQSQPLGSETMFTLKFQHQATQIPSPSEEGGPSGWRWWGGEGADSPSSPLGSRWRSPPPSGRGPLSPWPWS